MAAPYNRLTILIDNVDYTDYITPESFSITSQAQYGVITSVEFSLKEAPGSFSIEGGKRVDVYYKQSDVPDFSGFQVRCEPRRYAPSTWRYDCVAAGWESIFGRRQIFTTIRSVTYADACNLLLTNELQKFPSSLSTSVVDEHLVLTDEMPFYAINGAFPFEVLNLIANLTGSLWRVTFDGSVARLTFVDPTRSYNGFTMTDSSQSFHWDSFKPTISLESVINSQSVRGSQAATNALDTAYFRGDDLSSQFNLPTKPFDNTASVIVYDSFNSQTISDSYWFEADRSGDYVYADGDGFVQYSDSAGEWIGLTSRGLAARSSSPMTTIDITWVANGVAMMGFTEKNSVGVNEIAFLEAGVYIDASGLVYTVANGSILSATSLTLETGAQYRFRIACKSAGGCTIKYQTGDDVYTRNWTVLSDSANGSGKTLSTAVMSYSAGFALAMVKTVTPYLGVLLEVDRGDGFQQEEVGVYPIDEDVDAVIMEESTLAFFGSDPGPSTIPPTPDWNDDPDYKNVRVTYRRGVNIFATYQDNESIDNVAALFGAPDDGVREGPVIQDDSLTSYEAALLRAKTEVVNHGSVIERIMAQTGYNILSDAGVSMPVAGDCARYAITTPTTHYDISGDIPIRKVRIGAKRGLNDLTVTTEAGGLNRGFQSVLRALSDNGKLISINENQIIYTGKTITDGLTLSEEATSFGSGGFRMWGDSRLSRTFTASAATDLITLSDSLFSTGDAVRIETDGTAPSPITVGDAYYLNKQSDTTFYLYDSLVNAQSGGATGRVNISDSGSGTHTLYAYGWRYGNHRWNSFMADVEIAGSASMSIWARTYRMINMVGESALNAIGTVT